MSWGENQANVAALQKKILEQHPRWPSLGPFCQSSLCHESYLNPRTALEVVFLPDEIRKYYGPVKQII